MLTIISNKICHYAVADRLEKEIEKRNDLSQVNLVSFTNKKKKYFPVTNINGEKIVRKKFVKWVKAEIRGYIYALIGEYKSKYNNVDVDKLSRYVLDKGWIDFVNRFNPIKFFINYDSGQAGDPNFYNREFERYAKRSIKDYYRFAAQYMIRKFRPNWRSRFSNLISDNVFIKMSQSKNQGYGAWSHYNDTPGSYEERLPGGSGIGSSGVPWAHVDLFPRERAMPYKEVMEKGMREEWGEETHYGPMGTYLKKKKKKLKNKNKNRKLQFITDVERETRGTPKYRGRVQNAPRRLAPLNRGYGEWARRDEYAKMPSEEPTTWNQLMQDRSSQGGGFY